MKRKLFAVVCLVAAGVLGSASTASADGSSETYNGNGAAWWTENGDQLEVCDLQEDGWGTRAYVYIPDGLYSSTGQVLVKASDPSLVDESCTVVSKNISETATIYLKVCSYAGATVNNCQEDYTIR